ncbi:caspase family protein [Bacteroidota bacterium]
MRSYLKYIIIILLLMLSYSVNSQYYRTEVKSKSATKRISYRKKQLEDNTLLKPKLKIAEIIFFDDNSNNVLERGEYGNIELHLTNNGEGTARDVFVQTKLISKEIEGLDFKNEISLSNIYAGETRLVIIPINGLSYLSTGVAQFDIDISERFGNNIDPISVKIGTHQYNQPEISIKKAIFSTDEGGKIALAYPIYLKLLIENTGQKAVSNLEVDVDFENENCVHLGESKFIISSLESNETILKELIFTARNNYPYSNIPIKLHFHDKYKLYSEKKNIFLDINQPVAKRNPYDIEEEVLFQPEMFVADVDTSIPFDSITFKERYAIIIGNEDYTKHQPLLSNESNVIYAKNDAAIFQRYATSILGVPSENTFLLINATYAEMKQEIERVCKMLEKTGENAELIFYYAGHGFPDENSKVPYLIPIDVSATNLHSAIKLSDIYKRLSETNAKLITVFIDACFTGGGRESGLIAARAFIMEPKNEVLTGNIVVFNSSSGTQSSLPYHEKKHGIFTYFLLKKLKETKGYINYGELSDYLNKKVSIESLRINFKEQDPKVNISSDVKDNWEKHTFK